MANEIGNKVLFAVAVLVIVAIVIVIFLGNLTKSVRTTNKEIVSSLSELTTANKDVVSHLNGLTAAIGRQAQEIGELAVRVTETQSLAADFLNDRLNLSDELTADVLHWLVEDDRGKAGVALKAFLRVLPKVAAAESGSPESITLFSPTRYSPGTDFRYFLNSRPQDPRRFATVFDPQWHPSKPRILFVGVLVKPEEGEVDEKEARKRRELFTYDFVLDRLFRLTDNDVEDYQAKWSPHQGERIVFARRTATKDRKAVVIVRDVKLRDLIDGIESTEIEICGGGKPTGQFYHAVHPTFSPFGDWVMVTAQAKGAGPEGGGGPYELWMVNVSQDRRGESVKLFEDRGTFQCKGNWMLRKEDKGNERGHEAAFLAFNETPGDDPRAFHSRIVLAEVEYDESQTKPFTVIREPILVTEENGKSANAAPDFAGELGRIVFASRESERARDTLKEAVATNDQLSDWHVQTLRQSDRYSYAFPDWRAEYTLDGFVCAEYGFQALIPESATGQHRKE